MTDPPLLLIYWDHTEYAQFICKQKPAGQVPKGSRPTVLCHTHIWKPEQIRMTHLESLKLHTTSVTARHQTATWKWSTNMARLTVVLQSTHCIIVHDYSIAFIIAAWSLGWKRFTTDSFYRWENCMLFGDPKCMCTWRGRVGRGVERNVSQAHLLKDEKTPDIYFILISWQQEIITFDLSLGKGRLQQNFTRI